MLIFSGGFQIWRRVYDLGLKDYIEQPDVTASNLNIPRSDFEKNF